MGLQGVRRFKMHYLQQTGDCRKHSLDYGPRKYRLSTAQGLLFLTTQTPLIVRLNPDDGLSDRILGGVPADPKDFPWQVALLNAGSGTLFCGKLFGGRLDCYSSALRKRPERDALEKERPDRSDRNRQLGPGRQSISPYSGSHISPTVRSCYIRK